MSFVSQELRKDLAGWFGPRVSHGVVVGLGCIWKSKKQPGILFLKWVSGIHQVVSLKELPWLLYSMAVSVKLDTSMVEGFRREYSNKKDKSCIAIYDLVLEVTQCYPCSIHQPVWDNKEKKYTVDGRVARVWKSIWDKDIVAIIFGKYNQSWAGREDG